MLFSRFHLRWVPILCNLNSSKIHFLLIRLKKPLDKFIIFLTQLPTVLATPASSLMNILTFFCVPISCYCHVRHSCHSLQPPLPRFLLQYLQLQRVVEVVEEAVPILSCRASECKRRMGVWGAYGHIGPKTVRIRDISAPVPKCLVTVQYWWRSFQTFWHTDTLALRHFGPNAETVWTIGPDTSVLG